MTPTIAGARVRARHRFLLLAIGACAIAAPSRAALLPATQALATGDPNVSPAQGSPTAEDAVVDAASPAVVTVSVFFEKRSTGRRTGGDTDPVHVIRPGSGVVVDPKGLVLTNLHLVAELVGADGARNPEYWAYVSVPGRGQFEAEVVHTDPRTDLALLAIDAGPRPLLALPLGRPDELAPGERVIALSAPNPGQSQAFAGVLLRSTGAIKLRASELGPRETLLSDARFHASLDGGPLVDRAGRVLGIHNSSHVSERSDAFGGGEDEEDEAKLMKRAKDYAVIVSADAVRAAFDAHLTARPAAPRERGPAFVAVDALAAAAPSVVGVYTAAGEFPAAPSVDDPHSQRPPDGLGSGIVLTADGLVLTASDLFPGDTKTASVRTATGAVYPGELVRASRSDELALVRVTLPAGAALTPATLADSKGALAGEFCAVVARPLGEVSGSFGVLSALGRAGRLQVASWLHRGHLGGAVVDRAGRVLGIAVAEPPKAAGPIKSSSFLGFATPTATALESFAAELAPAGVAAAAADGTDALETRRTSASRVVERTQASLINVLVSREVPSAPKGFDPFAEPEPEYTLLGQGSGVVIDPSGLALSNWHVVSAALDGLEPRPDHRVEVTLPNGAKYAAKVLSTSRDDDLALLALQLGEGESVVPVELGDSRALRQGQPVIAIGNPLGLANSVTLGIVSQESIDAMIQGRLREYKGMVMVDAAINPGNSGGALLDEEGRLVGINSAGRVGAGMAIPVAKAREVFAGKLLAAEGLRSAFLGFDVDERDGRLVVRGVEDLGPAKAAGLADGDELVAIGGKDARSKIALAEALLSARPGTPLAMRIGRDGEVRELSVMPMPFAAWQAFRQSGVLVGEVDYAAEEALVHRAAIALHRRYTGDATGQPGRLMAGAMRALATRSVHGARDVAVEQGDLVLGVSVVTPGEVSDTHELVRFERLADLTRVFDEHATKEGETVELWLLRGDEVLTVAVFLQRPKR